jgi:RNA polymerase sigma-70 factor (ECF subfamily)
MSRDQAVPYPEDLDLIRRVRDRDATAVEAFMQRVQCVRQFVTYKNAEYGNPLQAHELEDTIQDALLAIWRRLDSYEGRGRLEAWLYRFSYLGILHRLRTQQRLPKLMEDSGEELPELRSTQEQEHTDFEALYQLLDNLGSPDGDILRLKHLEQLTFDEIGQALELPVNTVKTRYYRAVKKLRMQHGARWVRLSAAEKRA